VDIDQVATVCTHCVIENNDFRSTFTNAPGIYFQGVGGAQVRGNFLDGWGNASSANTPTIVLFGTGTSGALIENNVIINGNGHAISVLSCNTGMGCDGTDSTNVVVRNNTFRNNMLGGGNGTLMVGPNNSASLANNIFQQSTGRAIWIQAPPLTSDYNLFHLTGTAQVARIESISTNYATLAAWQGTSRDLNSLSGDPLFVSATDSHLQSPAGTTTPSASSARTRPCLPPWTAETPQRPSLENELPTVGEWTWAPTETPRRTR